MLQIYCRLSGPAHASSKLYVDTSNWKKYYLIVFFCLCSDSLLPSGLVMEVLWTLCERSECAAECLYMTPVIETLLGPVTALLGGQQVKLSCAHTFCCKSETTVSKICHFLGIMGKSRM